MLQIFERKTLKKGYKNEQTRTMKRKAIKRQTSKKRRVKSTLPSDSTLGQKHVLATM